MNKSSGKFQHVVQKSNDSPPDLKVGIGSAPGAEVLFRKAKFDWGQGRKINFFQSAILAPSLIQAIPVAAIQPKAELMIGASETFQRVRPNLSGVASQLNTLPKRPNKSSELFLSPCSFAEIKEGDTYQAGDGGTQSHVEDFNDHKLLHEISDSVIGITAIIVGLFIAYLIVTKTPFFEFLGWIDNALSAGKRKRFMEQQEKRRNEMFGPEPKEPDSK